MDVYENFAIGVAAFAVGSNSPWPFVTIPAFARQADRAMQQTGASSMGMAHVVRPELYDAWVQFSLDNQEWLVERDEYYNFSGTSPGPLPFIWDSFFDFAPSNSTAPGYDHYAPFHQSVPVSVAGLSIQNFDALRYVHE